MTATTASPVATAPTVPIAERTRPSVERTAEKRTVALPERTKVARAPPLEPIRARREVKTPPVEEHAEPVKLSPELAQEYAGKSVFITFTVTAEGSVRDARLLEKASPRCDECDRAALEAIKRYRFRPALDAEGLAVENKGVAVVIRF